MCRRLNLDMPEFNVAPLQYQALQLGQCLKFGQILLLAIAPLIEVRFVHKSNFWLPRWCSFIEKLRQFFGVRGGEGAAI